MLTLPSSVRIFLATEPVDMRKSIDGLSGLVTTLLHQDPLSGYLFVFRGRRSDRVKILVWDRSGFWLLYKRLEKGRFHFPTAGAGSQEIESTHLALLLEGLDVAMASRAPRPFPSLPGSANPPATAVV